MATRTPPGRPPAEQAGADDGQDGASGASGAVGGGARGGRVRAALAVSALHESHGLPAQLTPALRTLLTLPAAINVMVVGVVAAQATFAVMFLISRGWLESRIARYFDTYPQRYPVDRRRHLEESPGMILARGFFRAVR